jgi:Ca2+-binding RTX toxin-like protein
LDLTETLRNWANSSRAEKDLETVFGQALHWPSAYRHLDAFRRGDFTLLPPVEVLEDAAMPGLWGGYSRDLRLVFLSEDCPADLKTAVLLDEIGHFLDQELCTEETPGEEGAHFAALVLNLPVGSDIDEDSLAPISFEGRELLVEAARKLRGSSKGRSAGRSGSKKRGSSRSGGGNGGGGAGYAEVGSRSSNPKLMENIIYATGESVRIPQKAAGDRLIGSRGNDTFVVLSQDVKIEDPSGGTDTVESSVNFSIASHRLIENLVLSGSGNISATGNAKANSIFGNSGNNKLDGGTDFAADTLIGGAGNDTYVIRDFSDTVVEVADQGSDTIETTINSIALSDFRITNVENLTFVGSGSSTLAGNELANFISGGSGADTIFGEEDDTLAGGRGDDWFKVLDASVVLVEGSGALDGNDTISTALSTYTFAAFDYIEVLDYTGASNSSLTGNSISNSIFGGLSVKNTIDGGSGDDYIFGGDTTDSLFGGLGDDTLVVTRWADIPVGALGAALRSGVGTDTLNGGEGNDWYVVNSQSAYTFQEVAEFKDGIRSDSNTIASSVNYSLKYNSNISNNIKNLYLIGGDSLVGTGSDSSNTITGNDGANTLNAAVGDDTVFGGLGADRVLGDTGNDTLYGGGAPQTDIAADASTPIDLGVGQAYVGKIEARQDTDWIRVSLQAGRTYYFRVEPDFSKSPLSLKENSDVAFGVFSVNYYDSVVDIDYLGLVGDNGFEGNSNSGVYNHSLLVLNDDGSRAFGIVDNNDWLHPNGALGRPRGAGFQANNIRAFSFTAFDTGEFYIPVTGAGPAIGSYTVYASDKRSLLSTIPSGVIPQVLADDASNTLIGGLGSDYLVAGGGRQSDGSFYGDTLLGGTNGIPGAIDSDTSTSQTISASSISVGGYYLITSIGNTNWSTLGAASSAVGTIFQATLEGTTLVGGTGVVALPLDTLIGAGGADLLDGGKGMDLMIGGNGNDTYFIDNPVDIVVEEDSGGSDDLGIFSYKAARSFTSDLAAGRFILGTAAVAAGLSSVSGAGFDVDLANDFLNLEHASLVGAENTYILGNRDGNSLWGNVGNNLLVGAAGDDTLLGQGGNDYLVGGDGGDFMDGGSGQNTMDGGTGDDTYIINDRSDRIIYFIEDNNTPNNTTDDTLHGEIAGADGGVDLVRTFFNFDPIQGTALEPFQPDQPDNSPSSSKAPSFASRDLKSFYNLERFELLGEAAYAVGNALGNTISAGPTAALLLGMGGDDSLVGNDGGDSLYGDTPNFYATPDLYAPAPTDTRTQEFLDGIIGDYGSDYLYGRLGNDYLDGGKGFDTMIGGDGSDTFVQDHVDDYIVATDNIVFLPDELISSVNISQAPDGISKLMLVVKAQDRDANGNSITGQDEVASFGSFLGTESGNDRIVSYGVGSYSAVIEGANQMELMYSVNKAEVFQGATLNVGSKQADPNNAGKFQFDLSWAAAPYYDSGIVGYTVEYKSATNANDNWKTYVNGSSQDFKGSSSSPSLTVTNLDDGTYSFRVTAQRLAIPVRRDANGAGDPVAAQHVTLQGGAGNDGVFGLRLIQMLNGGLANDALTLPLVVNNPIDPLPLGFIFNPEPYNSATSLPLQFASYLDGGFGNDLLTGAIVNDQSGDDYVFQGVAFKGLNTLVGGQGSDTFVVKNGGTAIGDEFDWVVKYGNETPVTTETGVGASLNGGQHNLVVSVIPYLTLSDTHVHQGKFIDQIFLAQEGQFAMGNRLDNFISSDLPDNTLVGDKGRDSISGGGAVNVLIGGTAYGVDNVGFAIRDFASVVRGGNGLNTSIFRDTDPIPVEPNGPATTDPSQFWFVPGYYGSVFDPARNRDTLIAGSGSTLDGGAGHDSLVGSETSINILGDNFFVSAGSGGTIDMAQNIALGDAVFGNGGNDTVTFTDSDYLWWTGHQEGDDLDMNSYTIANDISNLVLQMGAPTARDAYGNKSSEGYEGELGSNLIVGNEFDNIIDGGGVGGVAQTGVGIDTLTGCAVNVLDDFDNFIIDDRYRNSTSNVWNRVIVSQTLGGGNWQHTWDKNASEYKDYDFAIITDFDLNDNLVLADSFAGTPDALKEYSIGNVPTLTNPGGSVGSKGDPLGILTFGIYYTGATYGLTNPNLVAVIQTESVILRGALTGRPTGLPNPQGNTSPLPPAAPFGWDDGDDFYQLAGTVFATNNVNQTYLQRASTASLSDLMGKIA